MDPNNREYKNDDITVFWRPSKCIHATTCYRELLEVFNPRERPWVNMQGAPTEKIIEVVDKCPTKALEWKWNNPDNKTKQPREKETITEEEKPVSIQVMKSGPLLVEGNFSLINEDGIELRSMTMTSLCRCGHSGNMPFCDGSHGKHNFDL
jgi:uncharacterized Fe-S cluster protein YjdI